MKYVYRRTLPNRTVILLLHISEVTSDVFVKADMNTAEFYYCLHNGYYVRVQIAEVHINTTQQA